MVSSEIVGSLVVEKTETLGFSISTNAFSDMTLFESQLDGSHNVITVTLEKDFETQALIDTRASRFVFIDKDFAKTHNLPLHSLKAPRTVEVISMEEKSQIEILITWSRYPAGLTITGKNSPCLLQSCGTIHWC